MIGKNRMKDNAPKVFLSYDHGQASLVTHIADDLMNNGIDVLFDAWDLAPGEDLYRFMESSVNDPEVDYVLIISDGTYKRKANLRDGSGVSTEALILSPKVYGESKKTKFIPIAAELDENNVALMPTFVSSKLYIDFSLSSKSFDDSMEELLRRIYNEPQKRKPALGQKPDFNKKVDVSLIKLQEFSREIEHSRDLNPRHSVHSYRDDFLPEFLTVFNNWLDSSLETDDLFITQNKMLEANKLFIKTTDNIISENDSLPVSVMTLFFFNMLLATDFNSKNNRNTKNIFAELERYIIFLKVASIYLKNNQLVNLKFLLYFEYPIQSNPNYSIFYPREAFRHVEGNSLLPIVNFIEDNMNRQDFHQFIQVDLLLYYIYKIQKQHRFFWYPLFWGKWKKFNLEFPLLNGLFNIDEANRVSKLFNLEDSKQLFVSLNSLEPIHNDRNWEWFIDFPLPKLFFKMPKI